MSPSGSPRASTVVPSPVLEPEARGRVLDPMERISEVLFGLIMALTFTGAISVAEGGREEIRTLLVGAIGCNVAWGIVDGAMYLMACLGARGTGWRTARAFRDAPDPVAARDVLSGALPPGIAAALDAQALEELRAAVSKGLVIPPRPGLHRDDWRGALAVFLLVSLTTFPVVVPFLFGDDALRALRLSNAVAIAMLFGSGWAFGRVAGVRPWVMGVAMVVVGLALVAVTMALGG